MPCGRTSWAACCLVAIGLLGTRVSQAQNPAVKAVVPPPVDIELVDRLGNPLSKDRVMLRATFYPGTKGKESVPVMLLHMFKGNRTDFASLAAALQNEGHAVLVPDLRGHGESTKVQGSDRPIDVDRLTPAQFERMVTDDLEACKLYLMQRNNAGELNIDRLTLVGAEMGAVLAAEWSRLDWSWPPLATGKQGQDAKALVLLSPEWTVEKGKLNMTNAFSHPLVRAQLPVYILYGEKGKSSYRVDADRIYKTLKPFHEVDDKEKQNLFMRAINTSLQGTKMLTVKELGVDRLVAAFIEGKVVTLPSIWRDRSGPLK